MDATTNDTLANSEKASPEVDQAQPTLEDTTVSYPQGFKLAAIMFAAMSSVFLSSLDETIIGTAIPRITDQFDSLGDVGWYGSAYFLTLSSFMMAWGRAYDLFIIKWVYLFSVVLFELGSLICGLAPNSPALIIGRAIAGIGSAGINAGFMIIISYALPLHRRPVFVSGYTAIYGFATVIAPLLGGAFTTRVSWRWCFLINIPFGAIAAIIIIFCFTDVGASRDLSKLAMKEKIQRLDMIGTAVLCAATACLLLVLQWANVSSDWSQARIIGLLVAFVVLGGVFILVQVWKKDLATVPPRIIKQRSIIAAALYLITAASGINVFEYYLPIWFQAIQGVTALTSGIHFLPMVIAYILFSFISSFGVSKIGYYTPFMIAGSVLMSIGAGLITTWEVNTNVSHWIGLQILTGAGSGLGLTQAHMAAQTVDNSDDIPNSAAVLLFAQMFGGAVFLSVAENVFENRLVARITSQLPGLDPNLVIQAGATNLRNLIGHSDLAKILVAYNRALTETFYIPTALCAISVFGALATKLKSVKAPSDG